MAVSTLRYILLLTFLTLAVNISFAQTAEDSGIPPIIAAPAEDDRPRNIREALIKQNIERRRKEHEKMLERGEQAMELVNSLNRSFESKSALSAQDKKNLATLEKLVRRIRSDLGGSDDSKQIEELENEEDKPSNIKQGFSYLKNFTEELVEELKKSSRFSISATAIKSTNSVIRLARFLRSF